jgi:hypothetical protein
MSSCEDVAALQHFNHGSVKMSHVCCKVGAMPNLIFRDVSNTDFEVDGIKVHHLLFTKKGRSNLT